MSLPRPLQGGDCPLLTSPFPVVLLGAPYYDCAFVLFSSPAPVWDLAARASGASQAPNVTRRGVTDAITT